MRVTAALALSSAQIGSRTDSRHDLAVSGKLDFRMGGPGFSFFEPNDNYVRVYAPKKEFARATIADGLWHRRRQRPDGVFGVFDCRTEAKSAPSARGAPRRCKRLICLTAGS